MNDMKQQSFSMPLPEPVMFVLDRLYAADYTAYCVGGCVRDSLMGKVPSDYDVTTSARPDEMKSVFSGERVVETGLKHGTLTVVRDKMNIEITTYRIDGDYGDCRHPESVTFTDRLSDDLCRRDFTVNAMAYSPRDGLVDLYGGQADIRARVIRCVGRAEERFSEDGLRILRALRFSSVLGFTPDEECAAAVYSLTPLLSKISRERIYAELTKLICGRNAVAIMRDFAPVIAFSLGTDETAVKNAADSYEKDSGTPSAVMRYALLLSDCDEKTGERIFDSLKPSREEKRAVLQFLAYRDTRTPDEYTTRKLISETDDSFPEKLARFRYLKGKTTAAEYDTAVRLSEKVRSENKCRSLGMLAINGNDLRALGLTGAEIGRALSLLLDAVMREETENSTDKLTEYAKSYLKNEVNVK